jgi:cell wall-associated NlpC family hydrolase
MDARTAQRALQTFYHAWQGVPYRNGGMTRNSVDCSGLMVLAYLDIYGLRLPRTVEDQARYGVSIPPEHLQPGDLLFFKTGLLQEHVGISLDRTRFIHASSTKGVMLSRLDEPYWQNAFWKANRLFSYSRNAHR